jgi:hypothetical protein
LNKVTEVVMENVNAKGLTGEAFETNLNLKCLGAGRTLGFLTWKWRQAQLARVFSHDT